MPGADGKAETAPGYLKASYIDQGKLGVAFGEGFYVCEPPVA